MAVIHNSSGRHRSEDSWPRIPLVVPRGVREWCWHAVALVAVVLCLASPGGPAATIVVASVAWLVDPDPMVMLRVGGLYLVTGLAIALFWATPVTYLESIPYTLTWVMPVGTGEVLGVAFSICTEIAVILISVGFIVLFDRRWVNRSVVDERVWLRQQERRRQLLRQWHAMSDQPEVSQ